MRNGPGLWIEIRNPLKEHFGEAIIAGGAVRDYLLQDRVPKDIDVFVNCDMEKLEGAIEELANHGFELEVLEIEGDYADDADWHPEVNGVLSGEFHDDDGGSWMVQIIARPMPVFNGRMLAERFDLDICKSWWDGELRDTPEACSDRVNKRMTLARWDGGKKGLAATFDRVRRLKKAFGPGWSFVDPSPAEAWA